MSTSIEPNGSVQSIHFAGNDMADVAEKLAPGAEATAGKARRRPKPIVVLLLAGFVGLGGWYGYGWWKDGRFLISTDDAYVSGDIAVIAPKISGYVAKVNAIENQFVKAGEPLVTLDDGDYRLALRQAEAAIATEELSLDRIDAQIVGAKAALEQAKAQKVGAGSRPSRRRHQSRPRRVPAGKGCRHHRLAR